MRRRATREEGEAAARSLADAEARGYARGVEDAAKVADIEFGYLGSDALVGAIRVLASLVVADGDGPM